jgi:hypothetical protein
MNNKSIVCKKCILPFTRPLALLAPNLYSCSNSIPARDHCNLNYHVPALLYHARTTLEEKMMLFFFG